MKRQQRCNESGFAILIIFAMAAAIAMLVYVQLPRAAFEAQRMREDLLVDRGHEYQRAIQLYVRKFTKLPQSMDNLEKANNLRFLRRRYPDPMTGKDEWRILHYGPTGELTDSLVQK